MSWKCYELKFRARSPIHIGYRKLGMINQTMYYIPGKTMWGAVTAILTRSIMEKYNAKDYETMGEFIRKNLIFSYFYPALNSQVMYPRYDNEKGLSFGDITKEEFENKFISSYVSTAVDPASRTAEDSSLHEFEYIKPDTEFVGYLFANDGNGIRFKNNSILIDALDNDVKLNQSISLFDAIKQIQVGGERNYGFGWIELVCKESKNRSEVNLYDSNSNVKVNLNDNLTLKPTWEDTTLTALAYMNQNINFESINGDMEPFVGREWNEKGAGQKISNPIICLTPGTKFKLKDGKHKIKIGHYGIWENVCNNCL
ncbi:MAG: hypothetical protein CVT90_00070 [Candidatus Altiarchaeales archaeon HGW-Altiarchaeales-3]|nr:MAG: hypothetical protein CVT90_00070 [Candidatus Altiarchaeales archaeon HGW-Altiarchaeales-3]